MNSLILTLFLIYLIAIFPSIKIISAAFQKDQCTLTTEPKFENEVLSLKPLEDLLWINLPKIFFIETSDRPYLLVRQACSIESAIRNSGLPVILIKTIQTLNLNETDIKNNVTINLMKRYSLEVKPCLIALNHETFNRDRKCQNSSQEHVKGKFFVRFVNTTKLFQESEMAGVDLVIKNSSSKLVHLSDALRIALIRKYGGWYADLDMIIVQDITSFGNIIASDMNKNDGKLSNAIFHVSQAQHRFMIEATKNFASLYKPDLWSSGGPDLLTRTFQALCHFYNEPESLKTCGGVNVAPDSSIFYPMSFMDSSALWTPPRTLEEWYNIVFKNSVSIHFFESSMQFHRKIKQKQSFYGNRVPALFALGIKHCPMSFYAENNF